MLRRLYADNFLCLVNFEAQFGSMNLLMELYHWGLKNVARSTFADANNSRPVGFFKDLFAEMYTNTVF